MTREFTPWLRLEGFAVLALSLALYGSHGHGWVVFAALLLVPDVSMIGYAFGRRPGALLYNAFHTYASPLLVGVAATALGHEMLGSIALVWLAHIGLDRMLGYGLKGSGGFKETHLGPIGGRRAGGRAEPAEPVVHTPSTISQS